MRKIVILLSTLFALMVPAAASAQGINLDRVLGVLGGVTAYGYDSCGYVNGGLQSASCQANRAFNVVNTLRQNDQSARYRQQERFNRRTQQLNALQRACQAGDAESCARSGGTDGKQMEVARALMDACTAGDRRSCDRAEAMMSERNVAQRQYAPQGYAQRTYPQQGYAQPQPYGQPTYVQPRSHPQQAYPTASAPVTAMQVCRQAIDPRTGYRLPGQLVCR